MNQSIDSDMQKRVMVAGTTDDLLKNLSNIVKALGNMFGPKCEVVLHDLRNPQSSIVAIANGHVSGRKIGGPIIGGPLKDKGLEVLLKQADHSDIVGNYFSNTRDGRTLKSTTVIFRNQKGVPVAGLCLNLDLTDFIMAREFINLFCAEQDDGTVEIAAAETEQDDDLSEVDVIMKLIVEESMLQVHKPLSRMDKEDKLQIMINMNERGLFLIKGGVESAAVALGVSRFTIYNYLKDIKSRQQAYIVNKEKE